MGQDPLGTVSECGHLPGVLGVGVGGSGVPTPESGPCLAFTELLCEGRVTGSAAEQTPSLNSTLILTLSQLTPLQKVNGRRISPRPQPPPSSVESPRINEPFGRISPSISFNEALLIKMCFMLAMCSSRFR